MPYHTLPKHGSPGNASPKGLSYHKLLHGSIFPYGRGMRIIGTPKYGNKRPKNKLLLRHYDHFSGSQVSIHESGLTTIFGLW